MKELFFALAIIGILVFSIASCSKKALEIRNLNLKIQQLTDERPVIWVDSCKTAVLSACVIYVDCATTSIEDMQEKLCPVPEGL